MIVFQDGVAYTKSEVRALKGKSDEVLRLVHIWKSMDRGAKVNEAS